MEAKESDHAFNNDEWVFEPVWEGYRAITEINDSGIRFYDKGGNNLSGKYPRLLEDLQSIKHEVILDGVVIIADEDGKPNLRILENYKAEPGFALQYQVFDILWLDGKPTTGLPLKQRKALLMEVLPASDGIRFSGHVEGKGIPLSEAVADKGIKGIVAKKSDGIYLPGKLSSDWLIINAYETTTTAILGYTVTSNNQHMLESLILGRQVSERLIYAGQVKLKPGESKKDLLLNKLSAFKTDSPQAEIPLKTGLKITWVRPVLEAQIKFKGYLKNDELNEPYFLKIFPPEKINSTQMQPAKSVKSSVKKSSVESKKRDLGKDEFIVKNGRISVAVSHPDKVYFPGENITQKNGGGILPVDS